MQEIKAQEDQLPKELNSLSEYSIITNSAEKKGYAGTAVFTKVKPLFINRKLGLDRFDCEGRFLELRFKDFTLINLYMPHGGRQKENLDYKLACYSKLLDYLNQKAKNNIILAGDFNIAHEEIDLARPKQNVNNIMFTPEERGQIDKLIDLPFIDSFRIFNQANGHYTWWPYMAKARERNLGWRLDYVFISYILKKKLRGGFILPNIKGSDHCPAGVNIDV